MPEWIASGMAFLAAMMATISAKEGLDTDGWLPCLVWLAFALGFCFYGCYLLLPT